MRSDLDRVADELEPDRLALAGREDVEDAAADGELAVLVGRIFAGEPGVDQQLGQVGRRDVLARLEIDRRGEQTLRRAHPRQQRRRRRDDDPRGAAGDGVKRPGARRRHADVRRQAAVRIDLVRGKRQDRAIRRRPARALRAPRRKNADVGDGLLEIGVARDDVQHDAVRQRVRGRRDVQRFGRRRQAGHRRAGASMPLRATAVLSSARRFSEVRWSTDVLNELPV